MSKELKQPDWCGYGKDELGDATHPALGCWSLLRGLVTNEEFCKNCELYDNTQRNQSSLQVSK